MAKINILWVGTTYPPAPGGGAIYLKSLLSPLGECDEVNKIIALVEAGPGEASKLLESENVTIKRYFPHRAGSNRKGFLFILKYILQNIRLLDVSKLCKENEINIVVIHSWYFIFPSVIPYLIRDIKKNNIKLVMDCRDVSVPRKKIRKIRDYIDGYICCGLRVKNYLLDAGIDEATLYHIPIPINMAAVEDNYADKKLEEIGLAGQRFIFSPNGIVNSKGFPVLYNAWKMLVESGMDIHLIVAGKSRHWDPSYHSGVENSKLVYLGALEYAQLQSFYKKATISVNISQNEGLPRVPLEGIHHGNPCLFPPFTPEFDVFPPQMIATEFDSAKIAEQIEMNVCDQSDPRTYYDTTVHEIGSTVNSTLAVLKNILWNSK